MNDSIGYLEEALQFDCQGDRLLGILTRPQGVPEMNCAVLIVVGGPQYRVGSHRQFVLLARALASAGFPVMRFDFRGMGDSEGAPRDFEAVSEDIAAALDALQRACPDVARVVLWGLCDAASAALLYCQERQDARVAGLCLLNPWVRSAESLARTHVKHYYGQRLLQADFWRKLLSGGVPVFGALRGLWRTLRQARVASAPVAARPTFQARMADGLGLFSGPVLLLLSGCDFVAQEFSNCVGTDDTWRAALRRDELTRQEMSEADHTFSSAARRDEVENRTLAWLRNIAR